MGVWHHPHPAKPVLDGMSHLVDWNAALPVPPGDPVGAVPEGDSSGGSGSWGITRALRGIGSLGGPGGPQAITARCHGTGTSIPSSNSGSDLFKHFRCEIVLALFNAPKITQLRTKCKQTRADLEAAKAAGNEELRQQKLLELKELTGPRFSVHLL